MNQFSELGVSAPLLKSLEEMGFENPTPIQRQAIPILNQGDIDFIGLAHTGTGKTAAFGFPLLDKIHTDVPATQALVLAPTRELCQQIAGQMKLFGKYIKGINVQAVYGGEPIQRQLKNLKRTPHILAATPGRLIDLIGRKAVNLKYVRFVTLDEADEMLNMGFKESIDKILAKTPSEKNTWLFSATMSDDIRAIITHYMKEPQEVRIGSVSSVNENIRHFYTLAKQTEKPNALKALLDEDPDISGIIFCRTRRETKDLTKELHRSGYKIDAMHGDLTQKERDWVMKKFREKSLNLMAATDVAARGMDIRDLTHVIHFSLPDDLEYYTHRSGRTARAGKEGKSIALVTKGEEKKIRFLEKKLKIRMDKLDYAAAFPEAVERKTSQDRERYSEKERAGRRREKANRYFINVGVIDQLSKKQFIKYLSGQIGVKPDLVQNIEMFDRHSLFEVASRVKVAERFKGRQLKGRALRVHRDKLQ